MGRYLVAEVHINDEWSDGAVNLVVVKITQELKDILLRALAYIQQGYDIFGSQLQGIRLAWWPADWYGAPRVLEVLEERVPEWSETRWALIDEAPPEDMMEYRGMTVNTLAVSTIIRHTVMYEVWFTGCAKHDDSSLWTHRIPIEVLLDPETPCQHVEWEAEESEE